MAAAFPSTRLRRTRTHDWSRRLHRETTLSPADLIWPLFVIDGEGQEQPVSSLPGVSRWSVDLLVERVGEAIDLGIPCVALFPNTPAQLRSETAEEAWNPDNLLCRAVRAIRERYGDAIGVICDVALDPYTSHGQDGLLDEHNYVANDATIEALVKQSLNQAAAGADVIAPSDMMDGRVGAIRQALEEAGHTNVQIMSYAAKFASAFYGPFRDAVGTGGRLKGDKRTYQLDPGNSDEAMREIALDIAEGADSVMVKPGLAYLDIIRMARDRFDVPIFAYQVSGEYALIEAGVAAGIGEREALVMEKLIAFKRAGCAGILTYHAPLAARVLAG
ncbi:MULTISPECIES: porphobilinogen synthase [unclassified Citromicrobium]|uniref:porphobilinogen synthase n=1 Tax=unclassified Citromicrobium TaxID=2630544 RepID=UPI0009EA257B|nr:MULTISPECIES: porphobilinogen synthase [unclassified Citromicrobium]MAO03866.1 porphobilinogen synthase [Citromicrobium sp.]|tara:strand:- start:3439 stop:4434 length:996 start_codon:yes stop_codon:yes gene_type:complete